VSAGSIKLFRLGLVLTLVGITWLGLTSTAPPMPGQSDKLGHLLAFLTLAFLADFSFPQRGFDAGKFLPLLGYGLGLELLQSILPHRFGSVADLMADAAGLALYALLLPLLRRQPLLRGRWDKNSAADSDR
jgi:VanZ family protein